MKPILFPSNATTFTTNGLGPLDCISCKVTEERNGMYELEMEIAQSANHASEIGMSSIIVAKPSEGATNQAFRVYKITKPIDGRFKVLAQHISYQLSYIPVFPFTVTASSSACSQALAGLKTNAAESCPFTFSTDVNTVAGFGITQPISFRTALGGIEGSILDQFGGEYEWNNYSVTLHKTRGVQVPTVYLRYGKNITDLKQEQYISNTVTGICPFWKDSEGGELVTLTEKVIESQYAANYPFPRTTVVDMSSEFEEQPTEAQLRARANMYLNKQGIGIPTVSIQVSFVNLHDTEEYKDIAPLQTVKLCDVVGVQFEKLGISTTAKVVKTVYDVLAERYDSVEIGSVKTSLASTIAGTGDAISALQSQMQTKFGTFSNSIREEIDNATAWLTSSDGYVIAIKDNSGNWKELIFADHNDPDDWVHCLRINENGIGFSSDGGQTYTQAWTLDGKLVIGGTDVPSLTVYDNATPPNILFQINASGMVWNAANSSLDATGHLSAQGATLSGSFSCGGTGTGESSVDIANGEIDFGYQGVSSGIIKSELNTSINRSSLSLSSDVVGISGGSNALILYHNSTNPNEESVDLLSQGNLEMRGKEVYIASRTGLSTNASISMESGLLDLYVPKSSGTYRCDIVMDNTNGLSFRQGNKTLTFDDLWGLL